MNAGYLHSRSGHRRRTALVAREKKPESVLVKAARFPLPEDWQGCRFERRASAVQAGESVCFLNQ